MGRCDKLSGRNHHLGEFLAIGFVERIGVTYVIDFNVDSRIGDENKMCKLMWTSSY